MFTWWFGAGIALYPGRAQLLSCKHHHHDHIPPLVAPGKPQEGDCVMQDVTYTGPYTNHTKVRPCCMHKHLPCIVVFISQTLLS